MLLENTLNLCSGCGACVSVCPKHCILMKEDHEGFLYPQINHSACISCRRCELVCPVLNKPAVLTGTTSYAVISNNENERLRSSSGGIFSLMANYILKKNGKVYGAAYNDSYEVEHICIEHSDMIPKLQGAKYSQSHSYEHFNKIREELEQGTSVLFVGTPCQTAGLYAYLGKDYENLILTDMVCHGVPSPMVWKKYLEARISNDAPDSSIDHINLRDKSSGWSRYAYSVKIEYSGGKKYCVRQDEDPYLQGFVRNLYLRPSCAECSFKGYQRCTDFTLSDCWGIWDIAPDMDDNKGTSLLMIHSAKGMKVWKTLSEQCRYKELTEEESIRQNNSAISSSVPHPNRESFFRRFASSENMIRLISEELNTHKKSKVMVFLSKLRGK